MPHSTAPSMRRTLLATALALAFGHALAQATAPAAEPAEPADAADAAASQPALPAVKVRAAKDAGYAPATSTGATKSNAPLRDVPQSVNVVPESVIRDQGARSLQDVLKNVPGVGFSSGDGQRDQVSIRGFTAIADQFIDGVRDDALYFRDLSNIERVEVLKGPAAVLYGRGSSGGLINRVTKKPRSGTFGELTLNAGSHDLKRVSFDANTEAGDKAALRVTGAWEDSGSYRDQGFVERSSIAPSVALAIGPATRLLVQGEYAKDERITDFGIPSFDGRPVDVAPNVYYGSGQARRDDTTSTEVSSLTVALDHRFGEALSLRNVTRVYRYDLDRRNTLPGGTVDSATKTVGRSRGTVVRQEDGVFNQTDLSFTRTLAGRRHDALLGIELGRQRKHQNFVSQANIDRVPVVDPAGAVPPPLSAATLAAANPADSVFDVAGIYLQDRIELAPRWKALLGVRRDSFRQDTSFARGAPLSRDDTTWSPRAGLVWQPGDTVSTYVSISRSYQPSGETFALASNNAANRPEQTTNREIGVKLDLLDGDFAVTGALFSLERTDIKSSDPSRPGALINVGAQRTNGFELTAAGRLPYGWDVTAGYAYLDGRITRSNSTQASPQTPVRPIALEGKRPSLTPTHSASLWAVKQLGRGFSAGGGLNHSGDRFASPSNAVVLPGYVTVDLAGFYRAKAFDVALNLKNAGNRRYIVSAHGSNDNLLVPGAPRELQVALTIRF